MGKACEIHEGHCYTVGVKVLICIWMEVSSETQTAVMEGH